MRPLLPRRVFSTMQKVDALIRKCNNRSHVRPALSPELCSRLRREFAPEVQRLSELLRHDLTHWSQEGISPLNGSESSASFDVS